jgi:hypothetical protein
MGQLSDDLATAMAAASSHSKTANQIEEALVQTCRERANQEKVIIENAMSFAVGEASKLKRNVGLSLAAFALVLALVDRYLLPALGENSIGTPVYYVIAFVFAYLGYSFIPEYLLADLIQRRRDRSFESELRRFAVAPDWTKRHAVDWKSQTVLSQVGESDEIMHKSPITA